MAGGGLMLGVDFGTSNTVAVLRRPDGQVRPLLFDESPILPSAVYLDKQGVLLTGQDALYSARLEPARFEPNPKRRLGDGTVLLGESEVAAVDLVAATLGRVAQEAERTVGTPVREVALTFPGGWGAARRLLLTDAAEQAGFGTVQLIPEPVAAAGYFVRVLEHAVPVGSAVVVYDFGAGTFDASVVSRTARGFDVIAVDGCDDIGGLDLDAAIVNHLGSTYGFVDPDAWARVVAPRTTEDRRHRRLLWEDVRLAKERLSRHSTAEIVLPLLGVDASVSRDELDRLVQPLLERTVQVTDWVLRYSRVPAEQVAGVFLVGGGSRMPLVATLLHRKLGFAPTAIEQPELVVAEGALDGVAPAEVAPPSRVAVPARGSAAVPQPRAASGSAPVAQPIPREVARSGPADGTVPTGPSRRSVLTAHAVLWPVLVIAALVCVKAGDVLLDAAAARGPNGYLALAAAGRCFRILVPALVAGAAAAVVLRPRRRRLLWVGGAAGLSVLTELGMPFLLASGWPGGLAPVVDLGYGVVVATGWLAIRGRPRWRLAFGLAGGVCTAPVLFRVTFPDSVWPEFPLLDPAVVVGGAVLAAWLVVLSLRLRPRSR